MFAIHRDEGPSGFAVYSDDGTLLADQLTQQRAVRMVRNGGPEPKFKHRPSPIGLNFHTDRLDMAAPATHYRNTQRRGQRWVHHYEGHI